MNLKLRSLVADAAPSLPVWGALVRRGPTGIAAVGAGLLLAAAHMPAVAVTHGFKQVSVVHSPDHRECAFFMLDGVAEPDPVAAGNVWFAVPKSHGGYKEIMAMLMLARVAGRQVHVTTTGSVSCGGAAVGAVQLL